MTDSATRSGNDRVPSQMSREEIESRKNSLQKQRAHLQGMIDALDAELESRDENTDTEDY